MEIPSSYMLTCNDSIINNIEPGKEQVLLGITVDSNLTFKNHINKICKRASQKLNVLAKVAPYMNMQKRRIIMNSFVTCQFEYCPLNWMFHRRHLNNKINFINKRSLRITYRDHISTFRRGYSVLKRLVKLTSFKSFPLQLSGYQDISLLSFVRVASSTLIRCGWVFISARSVENCISVERLNTLNTDLQSVLQNIKKFAAG